MPNAVKVSELGGAAKKHNLGDFIRGFDGAVIAYWATWCKPCTSPKELAHLKDLQRQLRRHNIELVSIVIDSLDKARQDPRARNWLYPFWYKNAAHLEMLPRSFIQRMGVNLPLFLVVSPSGDIKYYLNDKLSDVAVRDLVTATANVCRI
jgi:thiol-disulfide isomerase/thioredoxin